MTAGRGLLSSNSHPGLDGTAGRGLQSGECERGAIPVAQAGPGRRVMEYDLRGDARWPVLPSRR